MKRALRVDFVRFCLVGAIGFIINFTLLTLLYKKLGMPAFLAQLIASEVALFSNLLLHHHWTYKHKKVSKTISNLLVQFHMTSWAAIVGSALLVSLFIHVLKLNYVIALIISSGVALFWNFSWSKYIIWRHEHEPRLEIEV